MKRTSCVIGAPISANKMYVPVGVGKMTKSKKYNQWIDANVPIIKKQLDPAKHFPIEISIFIIGGRGFNSANDCDNAIKPIIDALVRAEVCPDDNTKYIQNVSIKFLPGGSRGEPVTTITYIEPEQ